MCVYVKKKEVLCHTVYDNFVQDSTINTLIQSIVLYIEGGK